TTAGSAAITVSSVRVNADKTVTLTLSRAVNNGETVTVSYTDAAGDGASGSVIQDSAGTDASSFQNQTVTNNTPPVCTGATVSGNQLVLRFDLAGNLVTTGVSNSAFELVVGSGSQPLSVTAIGAFNATDKTLTLTLSRAVTPGETVSIRYTDPNPDSNEGSGALEDSASRDVPTFVKEVTNNTPATPPAFSRAEVNGNQLVVTFTASNDLDLAALTGSAGFAVTGANNSPITVSSVRVNPDKTVTLTLARAVTNGETVKVSYTDAAGDGASGSVIQDSAGTDASSFQNQDVTNSTPPVCSSATVNGNQLVLHFPNAGSLSKAGVPITAFALSVDAGGQALSVTAIGDFNATSKTLTLTLNRTVANGETVRIRYTDPTPGNDSNVLQDATTDGRDVPSFDMAATNNTPATPPAFSRAEVNGNQLVVTFTATDGLDTTALPPGNAGFTVASGTTGSAAITVNSVRVNADKTVTLTLSRAVAHGETVTVSYTDPNPTVNDDSGVIQDTTPAHTDASSFQNQAVTNNTPPVCTGATVSGNQLVLRFDLVGNLVTTGVSTSAFELIVGSGSQPLSVTAIGAFNATDKTLTLTLNRAVANGETVSIRYTDPNPDSNAGSGALEDSASRDVPSFEKNVVNHTAAPPPVLTSASANGRELVLQYSAERNLDGQNKAAGADFTVTVNGVANAVTEVVVHPQNKTVTLKLTTPVPAGAVVEVTYNKQATGNNVIQDEGGTDAASFTTSPTVNTGSDETPPTIDRAEVTGNSRNQLLLRYDEANLLHANSGADNNAFTVTVNGQTNAVTGVTVDRAAKTVTLALTSAVAAGAQVSVQYTQPTTGSSIKDAYGNPAPTQTLTAVDSGSDDTPPLLITDLTDAARRPQVTGNGTQVTLTYTEANLLDEANKPLPSAFSVTVNGDPRTVTNVTVNRTAKTVTLTLSGAAVAEGARVRLSYTDPTAGDDTAAIQDARGNDAASTTTPIEVYNGTDNTPPLLITTGADRPKVSGRELTLSYSDVNLLDTVNKPAPGAFTVTVNGRNNVVTAVNVHATNRTVTLTLTDLVPEGAVVRLSYADPTTGNDTAAIQDVGGNDAASITNLSVDSGQDSTPPMLITSGPGAPTVTGTTRTQLTLTYTEDNLMDGSATGLKDAYTVLVNGERSEIVSHAVNSTDKTVTLTLRDPVPVGAQVRLTYTDPSTGANDTSAIQDAAGNDAPSTNSPVDVASGTDSTAPVLITNGAGAPEVTGETRTQLTLTYTEANLLDDEHKPVPGAFTVTVNRANNQVTAVSVNAADKTVTLTLTDPVPRGAEMTVTYTRPATGDVLQDKAGNPAANIPATTVNSGEDTTPPQLQQIASPSLNTTPKVVDDKLTLTYTDTNLLDDRDGSKPLETAFKVMASGTQVNVRNVAVNATAKTVTLTLDRAVARGEVVTVEYTDPTTGNDTRAIQDAKGNDAASTGPIPVDSGVDNTAPVLVTTGTHRPKISDNARNQLVLTYTDANNLHESNKAPGSAFEVIVNGVRNEVTNVSVVGLNKTVTLTLRDPVPLGAHVTVRYTKPDGTTTVIQDEAGNDALSTSSPVDVASGQDQTAPQLITTGDDAPRIDGNRLTLSYREDNLLDNRDGHKPGGTAFTVLVNGERNAVTGVEVSATNKTVTLILTRAVTGGETVTVAYTAPTDSNDPRDIQDAAGNDAASIPQTNVRNAPDSTAPVLITEGDNRPIITGDARTQLTLTYTEANTLDPTNKASPGAFTVLVNGVRTEVTEVTVDAAGKTVILTLRTPVPEGAQVTVTYTKPAGDTINAIQDRTGNDAASTTSPVAVRSGTDRTAPVLITAGDNAPRVRGRELTLTFAEDNLLDAANKPEINAFSVSSNGADIGVLDVSVNAQDRTVTLTLARAVSSGDKVSVRYTDRTTGNDTDAIQDATGNDVSDFTVTSVVNRTPAPATPTTPTTPTDRPDSDRDGISNEQEDAAHGLARADGSTVAGDGNGDGIKDSEQSAVSSINGMTLVAGSQNGKIKPDNQTQISNMIHTREAPADLPKGLEMPLGTLHFDATIPTVGGSESFSLYVDPARGVNGYWVKDQTGVWVNLASAPYGGQMVMEGDRLRLDFQITDGGQFDADGQANGVIAIPGGAAAQMQLSIVGQSPTAEQHGFWF
ncbi:SwmB domain-containing protein, partial [Verminephrobacter eiseniae]|uniref:SwmB domain-containing protein n=1 Tax=Verminephrobacter eiseniae TaxID=364317 RepID=UPI00224428DA